MIEILMYVVLGLVTWCVAAEGAWSAGITLLCVVFAGLLAMNFFEPVAVFLAGFSSSVAWGNRVDVIALMGLFAGSVFLLRMLTDSLAPTFMHVHPMVHEAGRWGAGLLTGYVTTAFLLTALHTAPLPRDFAGFYPEPAQRTGILGPMAPDLQWLGFTQYVSRNALARGRVFDGPSATVGKASGSWPTFPLRYATRRANLSSGSVAPLQPAGGGLQRETPPPGGTSPEF